MNKQQRKKLVKRSFITAVLIVWSFVFGLSISNANEFNVQQYLNKTYITIGAGYKFHEPMNKLVHLDKNNNTTDVHKFSPISARISIGYQYNKNITFGISHHSQWLSGYPVNSKTEYSKTEVFIDYSFALGSLIN